MLVSAVIGLTSCSASRPLNGGDGQKDMSAGAVRDFAAPVVDDLSVAGDLGMCVFTPPPLQYDLGAVTCPACLGDVVLPCAGAGACVHQTVGDGGANTVDTACFANGVRIVRRSTVASRMTTTTVYSKGILCYTAVEQPDEEYNTMTYYDRCGTAVATVSHGPPSLNAVECGGMVYNFKLSPGACEPSTDGCTPGVCN